MNHTDKGALEAGDLIPFVRRQLPFAPEMRPLTGRDRSGLGRDRAAVIEDLSRIGTIAQFLMEFPLPQEVEAAPVFQP